MKRARFQCRMCDSTFSYISNRSCHEKTSCKNRPGASTYHSQDIPGASTNHGHAVSETPTNHTQAGPEASTNHSRFVVGAFTNSSWHSSDYVPSTVPNPQFMECLHPPQMPPVTTIPSITGKNVPQCSVFASKFNPKH